MRFKEHSQQKSEEVFISKYVKKEDQTSDEKKDLERN